MAHLDPVLCIAGVALALFSAFRRLSPLYTFVGLLLFIYGGLKSVGLLLAPLPAQVVVMYLALAVFAFLAYFSVTEGSFQAFKAPLHALMVEERKRIHRAVAFVLIPLLAGYLAYTWVVPRHEPPVTARIVHPEPPTEIEFRGKTIRILGLENPLRKEPEKLPERLEEGKRIYYKNCFYCHGDLLDGKGHVALAFNPLPLPFVGTDTIAQLPESMVFFRIAKGWSGLPEGSHPWDSSMPVWEEMLEEEDIWKVILYIYEASGNKPRTW